MLLLQSCMSSSAAGKSSSHLPEKIKLTNTLVREGISVSIPDGWIFVNQDKPGVTAGFYSPDRRFKGIIEYFPSESIFTSDIIKEISAKYPVSSGKITGMKNWEKSEIYYSIHDVQSELRSEIYCLVPLKSTLVGLRLSTVNDNNNELLSIVYSVASSLKTEIVFTQQRIIEGKMSVVSLDKSWVWYDDIKDGFIFSSTASDIPLCISIMSSGSSESSIPVNAKPGIAKVKLIAGNTPLEAEYFEIINNTNRHIYIKTLLHGNLYTIHISTNSEKIKSAEELLGHALVRDFFLYNAVF